MIVTDVGVSLFDVCRFVRQKSVHMCRCVWTISSLDQIGILTIHMIHVDLNCVVIVCIVILDSHSV